MNIGYTKLVILMLMSSLSLASEPITQKVKSNDANLYAVVYPKTGAETILLLHGGPGVPTDFQAIVKVLSKKYQLITFDQRGTGRSPSADSDYSMEAYIKDIDSITEHFNLPEFHIFGHSWGGLYAQIYAEKFPQKILSLFLCSPGSGTGEHWVQTESEVMAFNKSRTTFWQWMMMGINSVRGMFGSDSAYQSLFKQVITNYNKDFDDEFVANDSMVKQVRADPANKTREHLLSYPLLISPVNYRFPIIVQYGEKDIYGASKEHVVDRFPQAQFIVIDDAGHFPWLNNAPKFQNVVMNFYHIDDL